VRIGFLPVRKIEVVDLVGAHEMRDASQAVHLGLESPGESDGRPHPKFAIVEAGDHRACGIGKAVEVDDLFLSQPEPIGDLLEHHSAREQGWVCQQDGQKEDAQPFPVGASAAPGG
jgi:hypothetical protein